jgi:hypothetical protein
MTRLANIHVLILLAAFAGCASPSPNAVPSTQPIEAKVLPPASTQPSNVGVAGEDFDRLWQASDAVARSLLFRPGLQDRRGGVYQTEPMLSAQWFEPWRRELRTADAHVQSSVATIRRTLTVKIDRQPDGTFLAKPEVVIERYSLSERRVTSSAGYHSVFRERNRRSASYGTAESDAGLVLPDSYWYAVGNDPDLERYVADKIRGRLAS